ncbi:MAG: hypothetical protein ACI8QZ_002242 [Chlamydiales bacterium]|jgi:hypothetical protein
MLRYLLPGVLALATVSRLPAPTPGVNDGGPGESQTVAPGALARVAVIGASASAGFLLPTDLGEALDWLLVCEHRPVQAFANTRFFLDPFAHANEQVAAAKAIDPTAVVALDFLFWFSYGVVLDEASRSWLLERGLDFLEGFDCPLLISTVPDMRASTGKMLTAAQVPSVETLRTLNERIESWAAARPNVVLVHLPHWHDQFLAGQRFDIDGVLWPRRPDDPLLLWDQLHPTIDGLSLLSCKILERLVESCGDIDAGAVRLDPRLVADPLNARMRVIMARR